MTAELPVLVEQDSTVTLIRLNRSEQRNALSAEMLSGICTALDAAERDPTVRAVVLTGGPASFASGADLRELRDTTSVEYLLSERRQAWKRFARFPKPMVAGVAGYVLGGGCELAMMCDLIVAADNAVLGQPEIRLGIIPGAGGTQRWARVAGRHRAAQVVLTGRAVSAWAAYRMGVVNAVVPAERLVPAAVAMADEVAGFGPVAARAAKAALSAADESSLTAGLAAEQSLLTMLLSTDDKREGIDAFLEKRRAEFQGR